MKFLSKLAHEIIKDQKERRELEVQLDECREECRKLRIEVMELKRELEEENGRD